MFITKHINYDSFNKKDRVPYFVLRGELTKYPFVAENTLDQLLSRAAIEID